MSDEDLEILKRFFISFSDKNEFIEKFINVAKPDNKEELIKFYDCATLWPAVWDTIRFHVSNESICLDEIIFDENNIIDGIVNEIKKYDLSKYKRVLIKLDNKNYEDIDKLSNFNIDYVIRVNGDIGFCSLEEFKKMREFFDGFKQKYSSYNLSNLEKITLAYDYIKFYLYNGAENDNPLNSRSIAKSLTTGNIVCVGYSNIFCQLLKEFDLSSNNVFVIDGDIRHNRVMMDVYDDKYNIKGTYFFDPTWDSEHEMSLVSDKNGNKRYKSKKEIEDSDKIIEKLSSDIRYLYYMVPIDEYKKYFPYETIERIEKYPSSEEFDLTEDFMKIINDNSDKKKSNVILSYMPELLSKVRKIEGYTNLQADENIYHAISILKQDRFGYFENNKSLN